MSDQIDELNTGVIALALIFSFLCGAYANQQWTYADLIEQCEAELPRNQKCVLVAVPEQQGGES